jgi:integrase
MNYSLQPFFSGGQVPCRHQGNPKRGPGPLSLFLMFRHGLRVSEACGLNLSQVDNESRILHVIRLKKGLSTTHPLRSDEIRVIKTWLADRVKMKLKTGTFLIDAPRRALDDSHL